MSKTRSGWLRRNGLSVVLLSMFALTLVGHALTGHRANNHELTEKGKPTLSLRAYLTSGDFVESVFENWESEFLQMGMYVVLTVFLFQKGSAESSDPDEPKQERPVTAESPWPARKGGWWKALYGNSLALAFLALFLLSAWLHAIGGARAEGNTTTLEYLGSAKFWFESFQNWQSEFLSVAAMVLLTVWLRQKGSPESKHVAAPHSETKD